jgi:hypothetical protein
MSAAHASFSSGSVHQFQDCEAFEQGILARRIRAKNMEKYSRREEKLSR